MMTITPRLCILLIAAGNAVALIGWWTAAVSLVLLGTLIAGWKLAQGWTRAR